MGRWLSELVVANEQSDVDSGKIWKSSENHQIQSHQHLNTLALH
jgi:hypothetical protein